MKEKTTTNNHYMGEAAKLLRKVSSTRPSQHSPERKTRQPASQPGASRLMASVVQV